MKRKLQKPLQAAQKAPRASLGLLWGGVGEGWERILTSFWSLLGTPKIIKISESAAQRAIFSPPRISLRKLCPTGPSRTSILMLSCRRERRSHFFTLTRKYTKKTPQNGRLGSLRDTISTFCPFFGPPILSLFFRRRPGAVRTPWGSGVPDYAQIWPCSHIYRYK